MFTAVTRANLELLPMPDFYMDAADRIWISLQEGHCGSWVWITAVVPVMETVIY